MTFLTSPPSPGKGGSTVAEIRQKSEVKAGVSKVVQGVQDRVLTVTGSLENVAAVRIRFPDKPNQSADHAFPIFQAYAEVARLLLTTPLHDPNYPLPNNTFTSVRLLISHNLMGSIIGKQGLKIKQIQDASGARMVASKEMLPQSTERVVEIQGAVEAIKTAILEIGKCLLEDWERGTGTVQYHPGAAGDAGVLAGGQGAQTVTGSTGGIRRTSAGAPFVPGDRRPSRSGMPGGDGLPRRTSDTPQDPNLRSQSISIPSDMVGCIM